ncbi:MAG TPA: inositol monophosphatase [Candidatus Aminicenantes bacterium]|nr:inositol monophosphatase [Candidatus Aminicenantes bacterium]
MEKIKREILNTALKAAHCAGNHIEAHREREMDVDFKGAVNLVTRMDTDSEEMIVASVSNAFPEHGVVAEEGGGRDSDSAWTWVIDPLDGTTNFAHGLPVYAISIGILYNQIPQVGVVFAPALGETFSALAGQGTFLNGNRINVSKRDHVKHCLLATGFPYDRQEHTRQYLQPFEYFLSRARDVRRWGAAALDLAYVAAGRFDAFWEYGLKAWDTAAGVLLVTEAGGRVTDFSGENFNPFRPQCLASNGRIHDAMLAAFS